MTEQFAALAAALLLSAAQPPTDEATAAHDRADAALQPVDETELEAMNGRQGVTFAAFSAQNLSGLSAGNAVTGQTVGSGDVAFGDNAFAGFNGLGNLVINTGHNNVLQGALSVTVVTPLAP